MLKYRCFNDYKIFIRFRLLMFFFSYYFKSTLLYTTINLLNMNCRNSSNAQIILIYYNFKGVAQIIRLMLLYLEVPFVDIFLDQYETQLPSLSQKIKSTLKKHSVNIADLPAIIHEEKIIYELNQIMTYLCRYYDKEDMLGRTIQQKAKVCEIMQIYCYRLNPSLRFLGDYVNQLAKCDLKEIQLLKLVEQRYLQFLKVAGYVMELAIYFMRHKQPTFVYENLTIVDFYFLQGVRQTLSLFGCIDEQVATSKWTQIAKKYQQYKQSKGQSTQKVDILRGLKRYQQFFSSLQFYHKNEEYYDSFKLFPKQAPPSILIGMTKVWALDQKYLHP